MSSPEGSGNPYRTPDSSPETTEADLRALELSLSHFRNSLQETARDFDEHFDNFIEFDETVLQQISGIYAPINSSQRTQVSGELAQPQQDLALPIQSRAEVRPAASAVRALVRQFELTTTDASNSHSPPFTTNLPLFGVQRSFSRTFSGSTMSDIDEIARESGDEGENRTSGTEPSESWIRFDKYATMRLNRINKELTAVRDKLADESTNKTISVLSACSHKVNRWRTELDRIEDDLKEVSLTSVVNTATMDKLDSDISDLVDDVEVVSSVVEQLLQTARDNSNHHSSLIAAFREIANSPTVALPTFHGETTKYASFKENFQYVIQQVNGPKELWATHLVNSLKDKVKQYVGGEGEWFNKYDELWEMLDNKYANKWLLSTDTVSTFFHKARPTSDEPDPVKNYFYDQLDNIAKIIKLGMSNEELCVNHLIHTLPPAYRKELRDGLRVLQPSKTKAAFSIKEVRKVFNDTIGVMVDEETEQNKGTLNFASSSDKSLRRNRRGKKQGSQACQEQPIAQPQQHVDYMPTQTLQASPQPTPQYPSQNRNSAQYPQGNDRSSDHGRHNRGRGSARGRGSGRGRQMRCYVCLDNTRYEHTSWICPNFPTPTHKREHLAATGRCTCCTRTAHQDECPPEVKCLIHPGDRHYTYLCGGNPHPGKNA